MEKVFRKIKGDRHIYFDYILPLTPLHGSFDPTAVTSPPASTANVLVTLNTYNDQGDLSDVTDPMGVVTHQDFDNADRVIQTIQNYQPGVADSAAVNITVQMTYSPDGDIATLTAVNSTTAAIKGDAALFIKTKAAIMAVAIIWNAALCPPLLFFAVVISSFSSWKRNQRKKAVSSHRTPKNCVHLECDGSTSLSFFGDGSDTPNERRRKVTWTGAIDLRLRRFWAGKRAAPPFTSRSAPNG